MCVNALRILFSKRTRVHIKSINRIALGYQNAVIFLDRYNKTKDLETLGIAAWFIRAGIIIPSQSGLITRYHYTNVTINGKLIKIQVGELYSNISTRLDSIFMKLPQYDIDIIEDIVNGGEAFEEINEIVPDRIKSKLSM